MNFKQPWNWLIVLATLSLVIGPVFADQYRLEIARWYLAAASNAIPDNAELAEARLQRAESWTEDITELRDYWLFQTKRALAESQALRLGTNTMRAQLPDAADRISPGTSDTDNGQLDQDKPAVKSNALATKPGDVSAVIQAAIDKNMSNFTLGLNYASNELFESADFVEAVQVLEVSCSSELRALPVLLNQLSYYRALAGIELDVALRDINQALKSLPDSDALRDTRAWVLFQMGRQLEALPDANFAVEAIEEQSTDGTLGALLTWMEQLLMGRPEPRSSDHLLTRREAGADLWGRGALYYHRAKILESLGRTEQAEADFQWLRDHRLPTDDRIY